MTIVRIILILTSYVTILHGQIILEKNKVTIEGKILLNGKPLSSVEINVDAWKGIIESSDSEGKFHISTNDNTRDYINLQIIIKGLIIYSRGYNINLKSANIHFVDEIIDLFDTYKPKIINYFIPGTYQLRIKEHKLVGATSGACVISSVLVFFYYHKKYLDAKRNYENSIRWEKYEWIDYYGNLKDDYKQKKHGYFFGLFLLGEAINIADIFYLKSKLNINNIALRPQIGLHDNYFKVVCTFNF